VRKWKKFNACGVCVSVGERIKGTNMEHKKEQRGKYKRNVRIYLPNTGQNMFSSINKKWHAIQSIPTHYILLNGCLDTFTNTS